jgi:hypothetical protein
LLKKHAQFIWTPAAEEAFEAIKRALVQAPVLALPDFSKEFILETDACATGVGAVLMQQGHPLAFLSKALGPKNQALSIYDKECLAILMAIEKWKSYLQHRPFTIHTDQRSLIHLGDHKFNTLIQQKAFFHLMGMQYQSRGGCSVPSTPASQCLRNFCCLTQMGGNSHRRVPERRQGSGTVD